MASQPVTLKRVQYNKSLPGKLNSHQMVTVSQQIHQLASKAVTPLLADHPHLFGVNAILAHVESAIDALKVAQTRRKYKSTQDMRGVSDAAGATGDERLSVRKRKITDRRQVLMRRFRSAVNWRYADMQLEDDVLGELSDLMSPEAKAATRLLYQLVNRRLDDFERLTYEESAAEFTLLFESIDQNPEAVKALQTLDLTNAYLDIKRIHDRYIQIASAQVRLNVEDDQKPMIKTANRDLRRAIFVLLTNLNFEVETGDKTFVRLLTHIDEIIGKAGSVATRRETLGEEERDELDEAADAGESGDAGESCDANELSVPEEDVCQSEAESDALEKAEESAVDEAVVPKQVFDTPARKGRDSAVDRNVDLKPPPNTNLIS